MTRFGAEMEDNEVFMANGVREIGLRISEIVVCSCM